MGEQLESGGYTVQSIDPDKVVLEDIGKHGQILIPFTGELFSREKYSDMLPRFETHRCGTRRSRQVIAESGLSPWEAGSREAASTLGLLSVVMVSMLFLGCAETPKPIKKPDLFSQWQTKAGESEGHSPPPRAKPVEVPESAKRLRSEPAKVVPEKRLPTQRVSLRMHNTDVVVVLRALARSVGQNILINDKVKGAVNIDIEAVPWDQAFAGVLRLQGLSYAWDGELLCVMTAEDLENELKIGAIRDKQKAQKMEVKQVEPLSIKVMPVNYANAGKLQEQLKEYLTKDDKGNALGSITVDEHTNSLVINAIRDDIAKLAPLVENLDKPTPQILIQCNIVQTTKDTAFRLGVQWGGLYNTDTWRGLCYAWWNGGHCSCRRVHLVYAPDRESNAGPAQHHRHWRTRVCGEFSGGRDECRGLCSRVDVWDYWREHPGHSVVGPAAGRQTEHSLQSVDHNSR